MEEIGGNSSVKREKNEKTLGSEIVQPKINIRIPILVKNSNIKLCWRENFYL
jgi:hypothetical protein